MVLFINFSLSSILQVMQGLAKSVAWDGEGATCLIEVNCHWCSSPISDAIDVNLSAFSMPVLLNFVKLYCEIKMARCLQKSKCYVLYRSLWQVPEMRLELLRSPVPLLLHLLWKYIFYLLNVILKHTYFVLFFFFSRTHLTYFNLARLLYMVEIQIGEESLVQLDMLELTLMRTTLIFHWEIFNSWRVVNHLTLTG